MEPVRILHVLGKLNRGGAETLVMNWYRNIDREKMQFDFLIHTDEKCSYTDEILSLGGKIYSVPAYNGKNHFRYVRAWNDFLQKHTEYRIIHGHVRSTAAIYLYIAKKNGRIAVSHSHSINSGTGFAGVVKHVMQYPIRYIADYQWACSLEAGRYLFGKKAICSTKFKVQKNAIDIQNFAYNEQIRERLRERLGVSGKTVVGHVGRFIQEKNHAFIIDVFDKYHNINNNSVLLLVGIGPLIETIKEVVREKRLEKQVIFLGERSDVSDIMQALDVFLFPSTHEGLGIVAIEAQASGVPVLMSDTIPLEVKVTDNAWILPIGLPESSDIWKNKLLDLENEGFVRKTATEQIKASGYDIKATTDSLFDEYMAIINAERN